MKEHPILFNGEMVKAILEGRKTQTRRIVKPQPEVCDDDRGGHLWPSNAVQSMVHVEKELQDYDGIWGGLIDDCNPFGAKGDRLWVRETWRKTKISECGCEDNCKCNFGGYDYLASSGDMEAKCKPSIHMPRSASRILLEITNIRVERLNDISEEDAIAEGVEQVTYQQQKFWKGYKNKERAYRDTAKDSFTSLWREIKGLDSWDKNPWVWVIEFKVIEGGVA